MTESSDQSDSAAQLRSVIEEQKKLLGRHEAMLQELTRQQQTYNQGLAQITQMLGDLHTTRSGSPPPSNAGPSSPPVQIPPPSAFKEVVSPPPEPFSGEISKSRGFLLQCALAFERAPSHFSSDANKISYSIALLRDRALQWANASFKQNSLTTLTYREFCTQFELTFCPSMGEEEVAKRLSGLKQGKRSVAEFSVDFRILAAESGWNRPALKSAFFQALNENVKDQLATRDEPHSLDDLIKLAIKIDSRLRDRFVAKALYSSQTSVSQQQADPVPDSGSGFSCSIDDTEPMQIGRTRLSSAQRRNVSKSGPASTAA